jgi:hypothetical protein
VDPDRFLRLILAVLIVVGAAIVLVVSLIAILVVLETT